MKHLALFFALLLGGCSQKTFNCPGGVSLDTCLRTSGFNGVVFVKKDGETLLEKAYGTASAGEPNTLQHRFRIGSVSKTFTAAAIQLLAKNGALSVDNKLAKYLPGFPNADRISLRQLLEHRSGIGDFDQGDFKKYMFQQATLPELVAVLRSKKPAFEPGKKFAYNNGGYVLLGLIIEQVSGQPYLDFLQKQILGPMGMAETGYADFDADVPHLSRGHLPGMKPDEKVYNYSMLLAIGGLYSTLADMEKWACCSSEKLFGGEEPLGWATGQRFGQDARWHSGITNGYGAFVFRVKTEDSYFVLMMNEGKKPNPVAKGMGENVFRTPQEATR